MPPRRNVSTPPHELHLPHGSGLLKLPDLRLVGSWPKTGSRTCRRATILRACQARACCMFLNCASKWRPAWREPVALRPLCLHQQLLHTCTCPGPCCPFASYSFKAGHVAGGLKDSSLGTGAVPSLWQLASSTWWLSLMVGPSILCSLNLRGCCCCADALSA